jgi:hypothetical protein
MFHNYFRQIQRQAEPRDARLRVLLRTWRVMEPSPGFEDAVWRKIRAEARPCPNVSAPSPAIWAAARPIWLHAAAATFGIVLGISLAHATHADSPPTRAAQQTLSPHTLAGAYLTLLTGDHP